MICTLTFDLDGDARPLRLLVVSLEHGVVGLARDELPVLEARGDEGDAALRLVCLVVLKSCLVMSFVHMNRVWFACHL